MPRHALHIAATVLVLGACATPSTPGGEAPSPSTLRVTIAPYDGGSMYIEGAVRYVHVTGPETDLQKQLDPDGPTVISLPDGGSYQLESWARPCDGNCDTLDGPTDRCIGTFPFAAGTSTAIEIDAPVGKPCTLSIIRPSAAQ